MLSMQQVNTLGQLINTTFGKSSTVASPTSSIKMSLQGNALIVKYITIVHYASEQSMREQSKEHERAADQLTKKTVIEVENEFKKIEGKSLHATQIEEVSFKIDEGEFGATVKNDIDSVYFSFETQSIAHDIWIKIRLKDGMMVDKKIQWKLD